MNSSQRSATERIVAFAAIIAVAICLVPAGAHLFEMSNKLALTPAEYMTVQQIYRGWAFFGFAIFAALALTLFHAWLVRAEPLARRFSLLSWLVLAITQGVFWSFTYPQNAATQNWSQMPANLEAARRTWEYSHAANAGLTFLALALIVAAALAGRSA
jgi:hypothetical protein